MGAMIFPPYGEMTNQLQRDWDNDRTGPPRDFQPPAVWAEVRNGLTVTLEKFLWPRWNPEADDWREVPSKARMKALTEADLDLIVDFRMNSLHKIPNAPNGTGQAFDHNKFYVDEDQNDFLASLDFYDKTVTPQRKAELIALFDQVGPGKLGTVLLQLKMEFQRPRAVQTAFRFKKMPVRALRALSAGTPSLPSGHAIQALLAIGAVIEALLPFPTCTPFLLPALLQLAVDIGDRRVFAGIHYPSDAIASWIVVMTLADYVFRKPEAKVLLREAIKTRSEVYTKLSHIDIYRPAIELI